MKSRTGSRSSRRPSHRPSVASCSRRCGTSTRPAPIDTQYGRRLVDDFTAAGLEGVQAEGRCAIVRGGTPPASGFLRFTIEQLGARLISDHRVSEIEFEEALAVLDDPAATVMFPLTVAAWGHRQDRATD